MILYFDSFITDQPLHSWPQIRAIEREVQNGSVAYKKQSRLDIAKYTLASYAIVDWSGVIIKYELQDKSFYESFDKFILELFPQAKIFHFRSDNQSKYKESIKLIDEFNDEWVFYAANNDHPIISNEIETLDKLIRKADQLKAQNNSFVSIYYSHFTEIINRCYKGHILHEIFCPAAKIIDEDEDSVSALFPEGDLTSVQIVHRDLMRRWFCTHDYGDARIIRSESTAQYAKPPAQIIVVPKKEICRHYDGYFHTKLLGNIVYISPEQVPSLFIPDGFFEKRIKISYGYEDYREGWVNINPMKPMYSFRDNKKGTDMICTLEDIPLFWRGRITEIDVYPVTDEKLMASYRDKSFQTIRDPWKNLSKYKAFFHVVQFKIRRNLVGVFKSVVKHALFFLKSIILTTPQKK